MPDDKEDGFPNLPPRLSPEIAFLPKYGVSPDLLMAVEQRARRIDQPAFKVLLDTGQMSQSQYYQLVAAELGLEFCETIPDGHDVLSRLPPPSEWNRMARIASYAPQCPDSLLSQQQPDFYLAPDGHQFVGLRDLLRRSPQYARRLKITTHACGLDHLVRRASPALSRQAQNGLHLRQPQQSAKRVMSIRQAVLLLLMVEVLIAMSFVAREFALLAIHLPASLAYLSQAGLRFLGWIRLLRHRPPEPVEQVSDGELPTYSILVALYDEANQVDDLVTSLLQLDWPNELLEIKLICEADDQKTIAACRRAVERQRASIISVVTVPVAMPRTKPKALNFALPLCSGEFLVVYDAEDRPHPDQLREAFAAFSNGPASLACLQAPLVIHNHANGWLPRMFAIEYSAHFDGFLPILEKLRLPIPLGGSSNHFKRRVLVNIGGWDPYNVTEDADLGMRLARAGCRAGTLRCPTVEEAPGRWRDWLCQRTRWFKGWYQTWLVHMRNPVRLFMELGTMKFLALQLLTIGAAMAALIHPFLLLLVFSSLVEIASGTAPVWKYALVWIDMFTILIGVFAWGLLAAKTLPMRNLRRLRALLWLIPVYWTLLSVAAWRALWQLFRHPHKWEKTPHGTSTNNRMDLDRLQAANLPRKGINRPDDQIA